MSAGIELDHYVERGASREVHANTETEYDELRKKAREEVAKRQSCMDRAHEAYERGDGATAKQLSNEGKRHAAEADKYFKEASELIFDANNRNANSDSIDLHGLYVTEAQEKVEERIRRDQQAGKTHLHVIVGKGIHSANHVQKLKPAIEELCQNLGLQYATEENEGRIYVNLQGGDVNEMPPAPSHHTGHQNHSQQNHSNQQQYYPGQQGQHYGGQNHGHSQDDEQYDEVEKLVTKLIKKFCCTVM
ncbi:hypothetical protein ONZ43_g601 [Nemania bipapillata]|uniref:Uncharacterized protein n=1 Tax=Nemania bipapillata TaxID=110536 RepID=A0ACC2J7Q8_9PEZI|nr:hypothetical protein ONZ43_g601 [Nemania bipapillata]